MVIGFLSKVEGRRSKVEGRSLNLGVRLRHISLCQPFVLPVQPTSNVISLESEKVALSLDYDEKEWQWDGHQNLYYSRYMLALPVHEHNHISKTLQFFVHYFSMCVRWMEDSSEVALPPVSAMHCLTNSGSFQNSLGASLSLQLFLCSSLPN